MKKKIEIEIPEGKVAEWQEIDGKTILVAVDEVDNRPVTERIKTFEDALDELEVRAANGDNTAKMLYDDWYNVTTDSDDLIAYLKLRIICAALNDGWEPKFTIDECRWYPWFYPYTQEEIDKMDEEKKKNLLRFGGCSTDGSRCGIAYARSNDAWYDSEAKFSSRLGVKSESLANYFGQQFIDIWSDYVALPRKDEK